MSSFMVEDRTINRIVTHVFNEKESHLLYRLKDRGLPATPQTLREALARMNRDAVEARYQEQAAEYFPAEDYTYTPETCSPVQLAKSIACYLYQCSEGDVHKSNLFGFVTELQADLAMDFVRKHPDWDAAEWG
jgi:hypothetical protein